MFRFTLKASIALLALISASANAQQPPEFSKFFSPNPARENNVTRLNFRLDNRANDTAALAVDFTNDLPAGIVVAPSPNISNTCVGGILTATAGASSISYTDGEIPASTICSININVVADTRGEYTSTSGDLTSSFGNSGPATSDLTVTIAQNLSVSGIFAPSLTAATNLEIAIRNFTGSDAIDAPLEIIVTGANSGPVSVNEIIPLVPANATVIYTTTSAFDLSADDAFAFEATTFSAFPANDRFISDAWIPLPVFDDFESVPTQSYQDDNVLADIPGFSYVLRTPNGRLAIRSDFDPDGRRIVSMDSSRPNGESTNSFILTFDGTSIPAGQELFLNFNWYDHDDEADSRDVVEVRGSPLDDWIEIYDFAANSNTYAWTDVTDIELTTFLGNATPTQLLTNQAQIRFNQDDNFPINTDGISIDDVAVGPSLQFNKAFSPARVAIGATSTLTITLDNTRGVNDATPISVVDNLPAGMTIAAVPAPTTDCIGGTLTAIAGNATVSFTAPVLTAGSACTIVLDVETNQPGDLFNISERLITSAGDSGAASATLTVTQEPGFSKSFGPNPTGVGLASTLTFTLDNTANTVPANGVEFIDNLPAGLIVADPPNETNGCLSGTLTAVAGGTTISYTGGEIPASASCTITVDVVAQIPGDYNNTSEDLTSNFGNSGNASDTLTVTAQAPVFSKVFAPDATEAGIPVTLTFTLDNSSNAAPADAVEFIDNLPTDLLVADVPNTSTTCTGGTVTAVAGSTSISYAAGSIPANSVCSIAVDVVSQLPGNFENLSNDMTSTLGNSGSASDTLTVTSDAPLFELTFNPTIILGGERTTLSFNIDNSTSAAPATGLSFDLALPAGLRLFSPITSSDTCTGGTLNAGASNISYIGGSVLAGQSCSITVDLTSNGGVYSVSTTLSTSLGDASSSLTSGLLSVSALPIQTLSTWGLATLILLMALIVFAYQRRHRA